MNYALVELVLMSWYLGFLFFFLNFFFSAGDWIPVTEIDEGMVSLYVEEIKVKVQEIFIPFKKLCKTRQVCYQVSVNFFFLFNGI